MKKWISIICALFLLIGCSSSTPSQSELDSFELYYKELANNDSISGDVSMVVTYSNDTMTSQSEVKETFHLNDLYGETNGVLHYTNLSNDTVLYDYDVVVIHGSPFIVMEGKRYGYDLTDSAELSVIYPQYFNRDAIVKIKKETQGENTLYTLTYSKESIQKEMEANLTDTTISDLSDVDVVYTVVNDTIIQEELEYSYTSTGSETVTSYTTKKITQYTWDTSDIDFTQYGYSFPSYKEGEVSLACAFDNGSGSTVENKIEAKDGVLEKVTVTQHTPLSVIQESLGVEDLTEYEAQINASYATLNGVTVTTSKNETDFIFQADLDIATMDDASKKSFSINTDIDAYVTSLFTRGYSCD